MLSDDKRDVLGRILQATRSGQLVWEKHFDGYFVAPVGKHDDKIMIRRMFIEATNQVGADPYFVELRMPFWNARFAITDDSEGWNAVRAILQAAFPDEWNQSADQTLSFFDVHLPKQTE